MFNSKDSFERLLNHKCDIYHHQTENRDLGYGLSSIVDGYPETADLFGVICHFHKETINVVQSEPHQDIIARRKVDFPLNTDIRINDKVNFEGLTYYAEVPQNIRNHHLTVYLQRKGKDSYGQNRS